jgi:tRNA threonylcarbamoyladenosine biosynthesis protein TsaB
VNVAGSYADALLPVMAALLEDAGRELAEVDAVGVTRGPGSFTGVRIGVATAKGLAWALGASLVAVPTLEAMAASLLRAAPARSVAVPVLDARRGEIFSAVYERADPWVRPLVGPAALSYDAAWDRVRSAVDDLDAPVWGGDGVGLLVGQGRGLRPELAGRGAPVARDWASAHPATASALAVAMGAAGAALPAVHPFVLTPLYLRASDAEVKRRLDLTPQAPGEGVRIRRLGDEDATP